MPDEQLLHVVVPGEIRDEVVDALIPLACVTGFSLVEIAGYSREHSQYSLREQVEGYRQFFRFEVQHRVADYDLLLAALAPACAMARCRYYILPVEGSGHFGHG